MTATVRSLGLNKLSVQDRLQLVQDLWDSIVASSEQLPISDELKAELDRRAGELHANRSTPLTWDQVTEGLRERR